MSQSPINQIGIKKTGTLKNLQNNKKENFLFEKHCY